MRLIDGDKLLESLLQDKITSGMQKARFLDLVRAAPTVGKDTNVPSKWISVEDRMPELSTSVLCYAEPKDFFNEAGKLDPELVVCFRFVPLVFKPRRKCDLNERWSEPWPHFNLEYKVTHWMPLPEPPTGDKS